MLKSKLVEIVASLEFSIKKMKASILSACEQNTRWTERITKQVSEDGKTISDKEWLSCVGLPESNQIEAATAEHNAYSQVHKALAKVVKEDDTIEAELEVGAFAAEPVQLRLSTPVGLVDLVFEDQAQFLKFVAGQHLETAQELLREWRP